MHAYVPADIDVYISAVYRVLVPEWLNTYSCN